MIYVEIEKIVLWYEENINLKLAKSIFCFLKKIGMVDNDIELDF